MYPTQPPVLSPRDKERKNLETEEQSRRIKEDGLYSDLQKAYNHFRT